ncbi:hypothetical protein E2C01_098997 [Portunus trituberculatus]|uniref:Uncharacterized protein n=1 Tax=Portunus trituberculatus TaxID=210409 RepID=A0A5B7K2N9_PORTR|nr:hypothetical protein [Portunus trituberculatus]
MSRWAGLSVWWEGPVPGRQGRRDGEVSRVPALHLHPQSVIRCERECIRASETVGVSERARGHCKKL